MGFKGILATNTQLRQCVAVTPRRHFCTVYTSNHTEDQQVPVKRKAPIKIILGRSVGMSEPELGLKELGKK